MRTLIDADANSGGASACEKRDFPLENRFFPKNRRFFAENYEKSRFFARKNATFFSEKRAFSRKTFPDAKHNFRDLATAKLAFWR